MKLRKRKNIHFNSIALNLLALLFLCMGIGFAAIQSLLNITGSATIAANTWDIHFENIAIASGSVSATTNATINASDRTKINFAVNLSKPGDYYEFFVDVVNGGTIDAKISNIVLSGLTSTQQTYVEYSISYVEKGKININDFLVAGGRECLRVKVMYKTDGNLPTTTQSLSLEFKMNYVQNLGSGVARNVIVKMLGADVEAYYDNKRSAYVNSTTGVDFGTLSSATNGQGLYVRSGTEKTANPIYYYRGAVTNNNLVFGGFCWKMVRTTETGGTKIIYNGTPTSVGGKSALEAGDYVNIINDVNYPWNFNTTTKKWNSTNKGDDAKNTTSTFKFSVSSYGHYKLHYSGSSESASYDYGMFYIDGNPIGTKYGGEAFSGTLDLGVISSSVVITATYKKDGSVNRNDDEIVFWLEKLPTFTCNNTGTDSQLADKSPFNGSSSDAKYVGYTYDTINTNSTIKTVIDNWYKSNILNNYDSYLEDTVWCNDRSVASTSGSTINYGAYGRLYTNKSPSLECPQQADKYTLKSTKTNYNANLNGNKLLDYPIALLTADEVALAGGKNGSINYAYYLYTGKSYWLMSPYIWNGTSAGEFIVYLNGNLVVSAVYYSDDSNNPDVRPAVSLKPGTKVITAGSGEAGTVSNPYVVIES